MPQRLLVFLLFFMSGATALVYQTVWVRGLTLTFGASHEAIGIVLASFMGGLALGGFAFGRWSGRFERPLRIYGLLEIGIGLVALVLPLLLALADDIYIGAARQVEGVPWWLNLIRVALAFGLLLIPTALMGGTLPILARLMIGDESEFGLRLSQLYSINTLGAVTGALAAGFHLLPTLGVRTTELVAVGLNLAIGATAIFLSGKLPTARTTSGGKPVAATSSSDASARTLDPFAAWALRLTFLGTAVSGMCALALEVMWTRGISIAVGRTTYSFTVMLAAFLIGIGLGSWLHAAFPLRRVGIAVQFGLTVAGIGLSSVIVSQMIPRLPFLAIRLDRWFGQTDGGIRAGTTLFTSFAVMLVPCLLMGIAFPLAAQARARLREEFGKSVGDVVGLNTLGAIVGSIAAAFFLVPRMGLQRGMLLASSLNLAYGLIVLGLAAAGGTKRRGRALLFLALASAGAALTLPYVLPDWDTRLLATFSSNTRDALVDESGRLRVDALDTVNVLYYREGRSSNVSVIDNGQTRAVLIDGKSVASDSLTDMQHELLLGHLPVMLHPDPRTAAVVGLGAGITLGAVLATPSLEGVVLVEIEPAVVDAARQFAHVNDRALDDPRLQVVFQDGRNYLRTTSRRFDVITADPIHPWVHGASYLYTREYYAIVADRLNEGGVMCQWLPLYELSDENVRSVIAAFADNFKHTTLWQTAYDVMLIGSNSPVRVDPADLERRLRIPSVALQLNPVGLADPLSFLSELTLDAAAIADLIDGARRNLDDNLYLEFSSPLSIATSEAFDNIRRLDSMRVSLAAVVPETSRLFAADASPDTLLEGYRSAKSATVEAQIALQQAKSQSSLTPYRSIIERLTEILDRLPEYGRARSLLRLAWTSYGAGLLEAGQRQEGVNALARAVEIMPSNPDANYSLATALSEFGRRERSLEFFEAATRHRPRFARAYHNHGLTLLGLGRFEDGRELLERAVDARPQFTEAIQHLAIAQMRTGRSAEAEQNFKQSLRQSPRLPGLHNNYAVLLAEQQRYTEALALLEKGLIINGDDPALLRHLAWLLSTAPDEELRDGRRAIELAGRANRETNESVPRIIDTLAAAYAEIGQFQEALALAERAADLAASEGDQALAAGIRDRITSYRRNQAHRL